MDKHAAWYWDGDGPQPQACRFKQLNMVAESPDLDPLSQAARVAAMADGLNTMEPMIVNCEEYGQKNVAVAIQCLNAARIANDTGRYGAYVTQANGDRWGICGKFMDPKENYRCIEQVYNAVRSLDPWVDFWCLDLFEAEMTLPTDPQTDYPLCFGTTDTDATWEIIAQTRLGLVRHTGKPWWAVFGVKAIPGVDKPVGTTVDAERLYNRALWAKSNGAEAVCVLAWDEARYKHQNSQNGKVVASTEIIRALNAIGKL